MADKVGGVAVEPLLKELKTAVPVTAGIIGFVKNFANLTVSFRLNESASNLELNIISPVLLKLLKSNIGLWLPTAAPKGTSKSSVFELI